MTLSDLASIASFVSGIAVLASLIFVGYELRMNTIVNRAQARHSISLFALEISKFRAEHADRRASIQTAASLTEGDREFRFWDHVNFLLHAETYFRHFELGLMSKPHWDRYAQWFARDAIAAPGFVECWREIGPAFSTEFATWDDEKLDQRVIPS